MPDGQRIVGQHVLFEDERRDISEKREAAAAPVAEFIVEKYPVFVTPTILFWRELICEYHESRSWAPPDWSRFCNDVHRHWKRYGKAVEALLRRKVLTIVRINSQITKYFKHGETPIRDQDHRNDKWYWGCLPSSSNPTYGIVCFPSNTFRDHPLIKESLDRREKSATSGECNLLKRVGEAEVRGSISGETRQLLVGRAAQKVTEAVCSANAMQVPALDGPKENEPA